MNKKSSYGKQGVRTIFIATSSRMPTGQQVFLLTGLFQTGFLCPTPKVQYRTGKMSPQGTGWILPLFNEATTFAMVSIEKSNAKYPGFQGLWLMGVYLWGLIKTFLLI